MSELALADVFFTALTLYHILKIAFFPTSHSDKSEGNEKSVDVNMKRDKPVVRPEEIPPVPENRFLLRRDAPVATAEPEPYAANFLF